MSQIVSEYGLMRRQEAGAAHRGRVRPEVSRERMRQAAIGRPSPRREPVPAELCEAAVLLVLRGLPQRQAARRVGISLGALQRTLKRMGR